MKDLFTGSLGHLDNHGGSRMFTTPNTIYVPPEYEVETDVPSVAEFVTCSLDGRLWVWKRSRRYYVAVFRWNEGTKRLEFVSTTILSNIEVIGRGIDWILTKDKIIQAIDNRPYIFTADLFTDTEDVFFYSNLRTWNIAISGVQGSRIFPIGSGIDLFTNDAWGLNADNGNTEGYGYFNRTAFLNIVKKQYSFLPAIGDWNIVNNFLVRRYIEEEWTDEYNSMSYLRPLIPLEFYSNNGDYQYPCYGLGYENDVRLTYYDGNIWGRGLACIGKCYILPAVFNEDGTPKEFYLYISPDFLVSPYRQQTKNNYAYYDGHTYRVMTGKNYEQAKSYCQTLGGHLASADTEDKIKFLCRQILYSRFSEISLDKLFMGVGDNCYASVLEGTLYPYYWPTEQYNFISSLKYESSIPYICEWDYIIEKNNDDVNNWSDLMLLANKKKNLDTVIYGFYEEQENSEDNEDSIDNGLCYSANTPELLDVSINEWQELSEEGSMYIDTLNNSGIVLDEEKITYINSGKTEYVCKGLNQWIAPPPKVDEENQDDEDITRIDAVTEQFVFSSFDNATLATYVNQELRRELLAKKELPITTQSYSSIRSSIGETERNKKKIIQVNSTTYPYEDNENSVIYWNDIYKQPIDINMANCKYFSNNDIYEGCDIIFINDESYYSPVFLTSYEERATYVIASSRWGEVVGASMGTVEERDYAQGYGTDTEGRDVGPCLSAVVTFSGFYVLPTTGEICFFSGSAGFESSIPVEGGVYQYYAGDATADVPGEVLIHNKQVCIIYSHYENGGQKREYRYKTMCAIPNEVFNWRVNDTKKSDVYVKDFIIPQNIPNNITRSASAIFAEKKSKVFFCCDMPSVFCSSNGVISGTLSQMPYARLTRQFNYFTTFINVNSLTDDESIYTEYLHVVPVCQYNNNTYNYYDYRVGVTVFKTKLHTEIFDFNAEIERSKLT